MMENPGKMDENWGKPHDQEETSNSKTHGNSLVAEKNPTNLLAVHNGIPWLIVIVPNFCWVSPQRIINQPWFMAMISGWKISGTISSG